MKLAKQHPTLAVHDSLEPCSSWQQQAGFPFEDSAHRWRQPHHATPSVAASSAEHVRDPSRGATSATATLLARVASPRHSNCRPRRNRSASFSPGIRMSALSVLSHRGPLASDARALRHSPR